MRRAIAALARVRLVVADRGAHRYHGSRRRRGRHRGARRGVPRVRAALVRACNGVVRVEPRRARRVLQLESRHARRTLHCRGLRPARPPPVVEPDI